MRHLTTPAATSPFDALTPRERDVLRLVAQGRSNKEIGAALFLSLGTVKGYVSALLPKLGVGDRTQAALFATKHGLE
jgi:two-component system NarL family response regulator